MSINIAIRDETSSGEILHKGVLRLLSARVTAREIIRERILQEVSNHNRHQMSFQGLVQPTSAEMLLNDAGKGRPTVDWRKQFKVACDAFERNGFVVLVDDRQVDNLDDEIDVQAETTVSFLKLIPLVGG